MSTTFVIPAHAGIHSGDLDGFIPGLRARGHEEAAGIDLAELLAALPSRGGYEPGEAVPILDEDAVDSSTDAERIERRNPWLRRW